MGNIFWNIFDPISSQMDLFKISLSDEDKLVAPTENVQEGFIQRHSLLYRPSTVLISIPLSSVVYGKLTQE